MRKFTHSKATRKAVPILFGIIGPQGCGKTFSALRVGAGIQRVTGGGLFVIDTEASRATHYADSFEFEHVPFEAPFGSLDYLAAIEHCVAAGAKVIVIDSMSHEHEGPGGLLEQHAAEAKRLAKAWGVSEKKAGMAAWSEPKQARRRLLNTLVQLPCNFILCFRAKKKLRIVKGKDPEPLGWMPICGEEFAYEMTASALLPPGAAGTPNWRPHDEGSREMVKLPGQFTDLFSRPEQLSEAHGEAMARWAAGTPPKDRKAKPPTFATKLQWDGAEQWAGKPLADAPADVLGAYGAAVEMARAGETDDKRKARWSGHLEQIKAVAS